MEAGIYEHYKGGKYLVIGVGEHTETKEAVVVYVSLDATLPGLRMRVRPVNGPEGFFTDVEIGGIKRPRFIFVDPVK